GGTIEPPVEYLVTKYLLPSTTPSLFPREGSSHSTPTHSHLTPSTGPRYRTDALPVPTCTRSPT
ncbi:hypothetical protein PMAYCL1PPCAC_20587, partial [Pristionchus mayeri]